MIRAQSLGILCITSTLLLACDRFGAQENSRRKTLSAAELGKRPALPKNHETKDDGGEAGFVSMVEESGRAATGVTKVATTGTVGADQGLGLDELSCSVAAKTEVDVIGLEKGVSKGDGFYLVQLRKPCRIGRVVLSEVYIAESDVVIVDSPVSTYSSTDATTSVWTSTSTSTSIGETTSIGCIEISQTRSPTIGSTSGSSTSTTTNTATTTATATPFGAPSSGGKGGVSPGRSGIPGDKRSEEAGMPCNGPGCVMPGQDWRAGAKNYALRLRGSANKFEFSFNKELVNGAESEACKDGAAVPGSKAADDGGNFAGSKPASRSGAPKSNSEEKEAYNCAKIPDKTIVAEAYKQAGTREYIVPYSDLIPVNDWRGVAVTITVKALDDKGTTINTCTQKTKLASPIVLDFTGSAKLDSVALVDSSVQFDLLGDGKRVRSGWVSGERGFLAIDLNRDGKINDGSELFGEGTRLLNQPGLAENGYEALRQYDRRGRGYIDSKNSVYQQLLVWFDHNQDGVSQPQEIKTLAQLGVTRIDTSYHEAPQYASEKDLLLHNQVRWRSQFFDQSKCRKGCYSYDIYFATESTSYMSAAQAQKLQK